jgi:hypothetical protein
MRSPASSPLAFCAYTPAQRSQPIQAIIPIRKI